MAEIGHISKGGENKAQGYKFRGIEQFYAAAHPALIKHGVFCAPRVIEKFTEQYLSKNGTPTFRVMLTIDHCFFAEDGSHITVTTIGEGVDTSDKASNKAMSAAMKYAFIELFSIPTEDVADSDRDTIEVAKKNFNTETDLPDFPASGRVQNKTAVTKKGTVKNEL